MTDVHPTALVAAGANLGARVSIGPFCTVGADVVLGDDVRLESHVTIAGKTRLGAGSRVFPFASLGQPPQIYQMAGEVGRLEIGARCEIREHVTINAGSPRDKLLTSVGDDCMFMVGSHVAHDCTIGNRVIFANNATLGGHVVVGDHVFIGGMSAVHQFSRIGEQAMIGGVTGVEGDVIPFGLVMGDRARLQGLNMVGLKRRGFSKEDIHGLRNFFQALFLVEGTFAERLERARGLSAAQSEPAQRILSFIATIDKRPLVLPPSQDVSV
jgi:UDP-N-acetylglucosamine acyltransferase